MPDPSLCRRGVRGLAYTWGNEGDCEEDADFNEASNTWTDEVSPSQNMYRFSISIIHQQLSQLVQQPRETHKVAANASRFVIHTSPFTTLSHDEGASSLSTTRAPSPHGLPPPSILARPLFFCILARPLLFCCLQESWEPMADKKATGVWTSVWESLGGEYAQLAAVPACKDPHI